MNFLRIADMNKKQINETTKLAMKIKKKPGAYAAAMKNKTLLMLFEQPSVRTRLSFEAGMTQMGGHGIYYDIAESTLGKKESIKDFARVVSRYADIIMARLNDHDQMERLAKHSTVPVVNAMTNAEHPCQVLADWMTMQERRKIKKLAYLGDAENNVTYSLISLAATMGFDLSVAAPGNKKFLPRTQIIEDSLKKAKSSGSRIAITNDPLQAAKGADVVYTDSWMSYRIAKKRYKERREALKPFQVNSEIMNATNNAIFMHCLPAKRGDEVTDEVIDSKNSVVIDQAENRLHAQKALLINILKKFK